MHTYRLQIVDIRGGTVYAYIQVTNSIHQGRNIFKIKFLYESNVAEIFNTFFVYYYRSLVLVLILYLSLIVVGYIYRDQAKPSRLEPSAVVSIHAQNILAFLF